MAAADNIFRVPSVHSSAPLTTKIQVLAFSLALAPETMYKQRYPKESLPPPGYNSQLRFPFLRGSARSLVSFQIINSSLVHAAEAGSTLTHAHQVSGHKQAARTIL
eukprot:scaffold2103_cov99-Skeletonema_dohrnii-CCMP3373.AAC.2